MTQEFVTIKELCSKYNISRNTVMRVINDLPDDQVIEEDTGSRHIQYKIKYSALAVFDGYYGSVPDDALTVNDLISIMNIDSPRFYDFIHRYGYYDKFIKIGKKVRRYQKLYVPKDVADEIVQFYDMRKAERVEQAANQERYVPVTDYIDNCYINDEFITMMKSTLDWRYSDGSWFVNKKENMGILIEDYMRSVGFITLPETSALLKISRQRVAQIAYSHRTDESICIRPSTKRRQMFLSVDFVQNLRNCDVNELSPDMVPLSELARDHNLSYRMMFKYLKYSSLKKYRSVYYYSKSEFDALPQALKESWVKKPLSEAEKSKALSLPSESPVYDYVSFSGAAKMVKMTNVMFKKYLTDAGLISSQYITTRNGLPDCKHLKIDLALINHIRDVKGVSE